MAHPYDDTFSRSLVMTVDQLVLDALFKINDQIEPTLCLPWRSFPCEGVVRLVRQ